MAYVFWKTVNAEQLEVVRTLLMQADGGDMRLRMLAAVLLLNLQNSFLHILYIYIYFLFYFLIYILEFGFIYMACYTNTKFGYIRTYFQVEGGIQKNFGYPNF